MSAVPAHVRARANEDANERVAAAWKALEALERPAGMRGPTWMAVWALLHRLCRYARYEVIRPTQQHLAEELGVDRNTVRTYLEHAEDAGLIKREPWDNYSGRWDQTRYHLAFVDLPKAGISAQPGAHRGGGATTVSTPTVVAQPPRDRGGVATTDRGGAATTNTLPSGEENTASSFGGSNGNGGPPPPPEKLPSFELRPNQYPGPCLACERYVEAGEGTWATDAEGVRQAVHLTCFGKKPGSFTPEARNKQWVNDLMARWRAAGRPVLRPAGGGTDQIIDPAEGIPAGVVYLDS